MAYITTPDLGLELADPTTIQAFETTNVNSNFLLLEAGIVADRVRISDEETKSATQLAGPGRGTIAQWAVASLAALDAISTALIGDEAIFSADPSTGISSTSAGLKAQAFSGSGASIKWHFVSQIQAATLGNMTTFIAACVAITDLNTPFIIGERFFVADTKMYYRFTSTAGAYALDRDSQLPVSAPTLSATTGTITQNTTTGVINLTTCTGTIDLAQIFAETLAKDFDVEFDLVGSGAQNITMAMLDNANALATAKHSIVASVVGGSGTVSSGTVTAAANWGLSFSSTGVRHRLYCKFRDVNVAAETYVRVEGSSYTNPVASGANNTHGTKGLVHEDATIMRGLRLVVSAGSVSGTITVKPRTR